MSGRRRSRPLHLYEVILEPYGGERKVVHVALRGGGGWLAESDRASVLAARVAYGTDHPEGVSTIIRGPLIDVHVP